MLIAYPHLKLLLIPAYLLIVIGIVHPRHFFRGLAILFGLLLLCGFLLQTNAVQNWLVKKAAARLSKSLGTTVSIKHVDLSLFNELSLEGAFIQDKNKDTLLYAGSLNLRITDWFFVKEKADLEYIGLKNAIINLHRTDSIWNYQYIVDFFSSQDTSTSKNGIELHLKKIALENIHLLKRDGWRGEDMALSLGALILDAKDIDLTRKKMDISNVSIVEPLFSISNYDGKRPYKPLPAYRKATDTALYWNPGGWVINAASIQIINGNFKDDNVNGRPAYYYFDGQHLQFGNINAKFKNLLFSKDTVSAGIVLSTKERSGFEVKSLTAAAKWYPRAMEFNKLDIQTAKSHLTNYFAMHYSTFDDMGDFVEKVRMQGAFKDAVVHSDDIAFFAPELEDWHQEIHVTGAIRGTVSDLNAKGLLLKSGKHTVLNADFALRGLPDIETTSIDFVANEFATTYEDVTTVFPTIKKVDDVRLDRLQYLNYKGNFKGLIRNFNANGIIETALGAVDANVNMQFPKHTNPGYYGKFSSDGFNLGSFLANDQLGNIVYNVTAKGSSFKLKDLQADLKGTISSIDFNHYNYQNLQVNGTLAKKLFNGELTVADPNLGMKLNGLVDLNKIEPRFNFFATVDNANLKRLKLYKDDIDFNGNFWFDFTGDNIDNFLGTARINNAAVFKNGQRISFDSLSIESKKIGNSKSIVLQSNELDAALVGEFSINALPNAFQTFLNRYYPSYIKPVAQRTSNENFSFVITTRKVDEYLDLFSKNLKGFNNSNISGRINSYENLFNLDADVPQFKYKNIAFQNTNLQGRGNLDSLAIGLNIGEVYVNDSLHFPGTRIHINSANDLSKINIITSANQTLNSANISGSFRTRQNGFTAVFDHSTFEINGKPWIIDKNGELTLTRDIVTTEGLRIYSGDQEVMFTSHPSATGNGSDLAIDLKKINIGDFAPFFVKSERLEGLLTGNVNIADPFGNMNVDVTANADQFRFNDDSVGKLQIASGYSKSTGRVTLSTISENQNYSFDLNGFINTADSTGTGIDLSTHFKDKTSIRVLGHYLTDIFSHVDGYVSGDLRIVGKGKNLKYLGNLTLSDASLMVDYTKCLYKIPKAEVKMQDDGIDFGSFQIKDQYNNTGDVVNAKLYHSNFKDMAFDFYVKTNRLLLLNTTVVDNKQFYGKAIGKASMRFTGPQEAMEMDVQAEPTDTSVINLPIGSSRVSGEADFLSWKVYGKEMKEVASNKTESNLTVNLKMTANNLAKVNVILDEVAGDQISASGHGVINMRVGTKENLSLNGRLDIDQGDYLFTFQSIKRKFKLREDESNYIQWNNDPYDASINIVGEYRAPKVRFSDLGIDNTKASSLGVANLNSYTEDVLVKTTITNKLKALKFRFDVELPSDNQLANDPSLSLLISQFIEKDENERNKQSSLLIVFNSFGPLSSSTNAGMNVFNKGFEGIFLNSVSGFVSSQVSKFVSSKFQNIFKDPNMRVNFSTYAYSGAQLTDVATQTNFLPDRVNALVSLNKSYFNQRLTFIVGSALDFGVSAASAANTRNNFQILPDVTAQLKLTADGKVLFNLFYRENRGYLTSLNNKQSRSGASISYRKEFEHFGDLFKKEKKKN